MKLRCAGLIRRIDAQLHLSKSPSYRRAVGRSAWCLAHGQHRRIVAQGPDRRGTERKVWATQLNARGAGSLVLYRVLIVQVRCGPILQKEGLEQT